MNDYDFQMIGNLGVNVNEHNVIAFQMGSNPLGSMDDDPIFSDRKTLIGSSQRWLSVNDYQVAARGANNMLVEEIERDIEGNRILPRLYSKQANILYGYGPMLYKNVLKDNKIIRQWNDNRDVMNNLDSWMNNGMEQSYTDVIKSNIKNYYYFRDFFVKVRMSLGSSIGRMPIAGLESMENKDCRLATKRPDIATSMIQYRDLKNVAVGRWTYGGTQFGIYPRFNLSDVGSYNFAAVSHHREKSIGDYYGSNETHQGTRAYIRGANKTADYINSFLTNSLAAKFHVIIPNAWVDRKRSQIQSICQENRKRKEKGLSYIKFNDLEVESEYKESDLINYTNQEIKKLSQYLSGKDNQGKAMVTYSYRTGQNNEEERWKIEPVDMRYKEYIESLITYDKRADEVISTSVGFDASVSGISKDGIISKSGSDLYYNYLMYIISLTPDEEKVMECFNQIYLACNFPKLYADGYRIGLYREVPSKQQDVSPADRLNTTPQ